MDINKNLNNIYEFKFYKFYNNKDPNNYIIYNKDFSTFFYNNKQLCDFKLNDVNKKLLSNNKNLFMILYNATCHFLDIDIKYDTKNMKIYDNYLNKQNEDYLNKQNKEISKSREHIKDYLIKLLKININYEELFFENFKYFNEYVCEEIENNCIENKLKLKKYILNELMNFDKYIFDNITNKEYELLNKKKSKFNNLIEIQTFYNDKINIINYYFNKLINEKCSDDKHDIIINKIKKIYFYELCDYISEIYDIKNDILELYLNIYSYFDKVIMYN